MTDIAPTIERFDLTVGPLTFQARQAGPPDGRLVLLLHGAPQTSACWNHQLPALAAAGHRAVAFTQRGYSPGARFDDVEAYTLDKLVGDVLDVADTLGFDRFDVVGHDFGGGIAWAVAGHHPDRVSTLTVASTPHPAAFAHAYRSTAGSGRGRPARAIRLHADDQADTQGRPRAHVPRRRRQDDAGHVRRSARRQRRRVHRRSSAPSKACGPRWTGTGPGPTRPRAAVPPASMPTLFVWADNDPALGPAAAEATAELRHRPLPLRRPRRRRPLDPRARRRRFNAELVAHLAAHPA